MTDDHELFDRLRNANPYATSGDLPPTTTSRRARFEEITMQPTTTSPRVSPSRLRPLWKRPQFAAPIALALAALVAVGALLASTATAPSAQALVTEAAAQAATHESGRMELVLEFGDLPDELADFDRLVMRHQFDGVDFDNTLTFEEGGVAAETLHTLRVGNTNYIEVNDGGATGSWEETGPNTLGLDPETFGPDSALPILEQAEDFTATSSSDGIDVYTATILTSLIQSIPEAELPPGLALLQGSEDDVALLPETLLLELTVADGQLTRMVVDVVAENDKMIDATITTTFSELGDAQEINAPVR